MIWRRERMMNALIYYLCAALRQLCRRLSLCMSRHFIDRESEWADAEDVEDDVEQDARFLRFQLIKARAENTGLKRQSYDLWRKIPEPFHMTRKQLQELGHGYEIQGQAGGTDWLVVVNRCVFCGCGLEQVAFSTERDALLYAALLHAVGHEPRHNLSCPACYEEYEKSKELSTD